MQVACDVIFAQAAKQGAPRKKMLAHKGFKMRGELAVAAIVKEFT